MAADGKLFVGGISWDTTDETLKQYFLRYGDVFDAVVMREPGTGRSRGFGFVTFVDPASCDRVLREKHVIDGKTVDPKRAVPRDQIATQPHTRAPVPAVASVGVGLASGNGSDYGPTGGGAGGGGGGGGDVYARKIFVGGIAQSTTEDVLREYFEQYGEVEEVLLMIDKATMRTRGFAFVTFDSEDAVERAVERRMHEIDNKPNVEVKRAEPKGFRSVNSGGSGGGQPVPAAWRSSFAVPYVGDGGGRGYGSPGGYGVPPTQSSYAVPYGAGGAGYDYESSFYTVGPGALGGFAGAAGLATRPTSSLAVPYQGYAASAGFAPGYVAPGAAPSYAAAYDASAASAAQLSPVPRVRALHGAIGSGYQDPYYGSAGASDLGSGEFDEPQAGAVPRAAGEYDADEYSDIYADSDAADAGGAAAAAAPPAPYGAVASFPLPLAYYVRVPGTGLIALHPPLALVSPVSGSPGPVAAFGVPVGGADGIGALPALHAPAE